MPKRRHAANLFLRTRPTLSWSTLVGSSGRGRLPSPLDGGGVTFYFKARNGLWHLIRALGVQPSETILVPSYNCGAELDAVLKAPATIRFYRVDESARIDLDDLHRAIDSRTRAVVVTHYFGVAEPELLELVELCRHRGLFLIEDCAPALYSTHLNRPVGTFGDAAVFSLWKTLPMPDGGAVLANSTVPLDGGTVVPPLDGSLTVLRSNLEGHMLLRYGRAGRVTVSLSGRLAELGSRASKYRSRPETPGRLDPPASPHITFELSTADWAMSRTAHRIASRSAHVEIARRRRENYASLAAELDGVTGARPLYPTLPDGTCPLRFPLIVDEPDSLKSHLERNAIGSELFWSDFHPAFPAHEFPESTHLKTHIVAVPIHQDLDLESVARLAAAVRAWSRTR